MPFFLLMLFAFTSLFAQESLTEIQRNIRAVRAETEREKNLMQEEFKRHSAFMENAKQKTAVFETQEKELLKQVDSLKAEVENIKNARQKALNTARYYENRRAKYIEDLAKAIDSLALFAESGFSYKNSEAAETLREISLQLKKELISPEAAFGRAWEAMLERIRIGYTAETWSGDGGKYFRYGLLSSIFVSQNGETVLWFNSKSGKWENLDENFTLRSALKETMRVAEGKTAPKLSLIPIPR